MKHISIIIFLLISCSSYSQKVHIINKSDLQPVSNCQVINQDKTVFTASDNFGIADLSKFKDTDRLTFSHISFIPVEYLKADFKNVVTEIMLQTAVINLMEVVMSANKVVENHTDLPIRIDIIPARQIQFENPQTTAELLQQNGTVFVQQSQLGGGSPVIRGMEANRVLMVIDGVRMNNAIYRAGHLQNVITIDPNILSRAEVIHGPGSVIYGSDAMGGVMNFFTRNPVFSSDSKIFSSGNAMFRYSSAAKELANSLTLNIGGNKLAAIISFNYKNIGDLREGYKHDRKYGDWGKSLYYAGIVNGQDAMIINNNPLIQKNSGYSQYDLFSKVSYKPNEYYHLTLNTQFSNSGNIPRYDRLTEISGGKLKYAEWYYGPQNRALLSLTNEFTRSNYLFDHLKLTTSYQNIGEDRISRSFGKSKRKHQEEILNIFSVNADFFRQIFNSCELRYGIEQIVEKEESKAYNQNINTGVITNDAASRYPDGGNSMNHFAVYASNNWEITPKLIFSQGLRFNYITLNAKYSQQMMELIKFPFDSSVKQKNTSVSGNLGLVFRPDGGWRFTSSISNGFRAPNIDDLTKLNDSNSTDKLIIVPNPDLKPENTYNAELSVGKTFRNCIQFEITGFYSLLKNAFVVKPSLYNGMNQILFDGNLCNVQSMQNANQAIVSGLEGSFIAQISESLSVRSSLTYTYGYIKEDNVPLDHIPPLFGITSAKLNLKKFSNEFFVRYNGWKRIEDYSPGGEDNQSYATIDGMPSWITLNFRTGYQFNSFFSMQAGLENILDVHYRNFASGISAPGRNFLISLRGSF